MAPATVALAGLLALVACQEWHLSVNQDGLVFVSVIGSTGEPRHRFRVRARQADGNIQTLDVPASGRLTLRPGSEGTLELTLLTPRECRVSGSNPRTLLLSAGQELRLAFDVQCG